MNQNVTVMAKVHAKKGKENELRELLLSLIDPTRGEAACINYDLHESVKDPGLFLFYENWISAAGLGQHFETPHVKEALKKAEALLAEPLEIQTLSMVSRPQVKSPAGKS